MTTESSTISCFDVDCKKPFVIPQDEVTPYFFNDLLFNEESRIKEYKKILDTVDPNHGVIIQGTDFYSAEASDLVKHYFNLQTIPTGDKIRHSITPSTYTLQYPQNNTKVEHKFDWFPSTMIPNFFSDDSVYWHNKPTIVNNQTFNVNFNYFKHEKSFEDKMNFYTRNEFITILKKKKKMIKSLIYYMRCISVICQTTPTISCAYYQYQKM